MALGMKKQLPKPEEDKSIQINAEMQGSLVFKDPVNLKINGTFQGSLEVCGTLTIGGMAKVEAHIKGENIIIAGRVNGNIAAKRMLVLMPTAILKGDVETPKLNIVEGAVFDGNCRMMQMRAESNGPGEDNLLTLSDVARYLEIDPREIDELAKAGKIPAVRKGEEWKFDRDQIDSWASTGQVR
ncbi:MAG: polymer-forming cytoskeletal protein [Candidatus Omnitrophica bacterium]|nr:polymer-forming cytoskeletal protein [Candidatus Omnitrophota bacterium]